MPNKTMLLNRNEQNYKILVCIKTTIFFNLKYSKIC